MANNNLVSNDSFTSGSLAPGWSAALGNSECNIVGSSPYYAEPGSTTGAYGQIWTGTTYPGDQISEVTVETLTSESTTTLTLFCRISDTSSTPNGYEAVISNGTLIINRLDAGVPTQIGSTITGLTFASGDIWDFAMAGCAVIVYQNFVLLTPPGMLDTTYITGAPGFQLSSTSNVAHAQIASWRGYNMIQQDGAWQKQGIVMPATAADVSPGEGIISISQVLHEGNAQILSGTVYKAWTQYGGFSSTNCGYAESLDGISWTQYSGNPILSVGPAAVFKYGSTYYLYAQGSPGSSVFTCYTSSNGINWTSQGSTGIGLGTGGAWDSTNIWTFQPVLVSGTIGSGGTAYALYSADLSGGIFKTGLATSTNLITWTKYSGNPVTNGYTQQGVVTLGGTTYGWFCGDNSTAPDDMFRLQSTDLINWTNKTRSIHRSQMYEAMNNTTGQVYMGSIMTVGTGTYMWYSSTMKNGSPGPYQVSLATVPVPLSQLVTGLEDGTVPIASDAFTSGIGPLSANWTTPSSMDALQIVAGPYCEPTTQGAAQNGAVYTGATFSADQYSEVVIQTLGSTGYIYPTVRMQTTGANFYYYLCHNGGNRGIKKYVNGSAIAIGAVFDLNVFSGDTIRLEVIGSSPVTLTLFQNGFQVWQVQDWNNSFTSGNPGVSQYANSPFTDSQISSWAGGNAGVVPSYNPSSTTNTYTGGSSLLRKGYRLNY